MTTFRISEIKFRNSAYLEASVIQALICPLCKTKIHSPHFICLLLQKLVAKRTQGQKSFHLDDPSPGHYRVSKATHDELQMSPVIPEPVTPSVFSWRA